MSEKTEVDATDAQAEERAKDILAHECFQVIDEQTAKADGCPDCQKCDGTLEGPFEGTVGGSRRFWHVCHQHSKKWRAESGVPDTTDGCRRNAEILASYAEVEPHRLTVTRFSLAYLWVAPGAIMKCPVCSAAVKTGGRYRVFVRTLPQFPICAGCARQHARDLAEFIHLADTAEQFAGLLNELGIVIQPVESYESGTPF